MSETSPAEAGVERGDQRPSLVERLRACRCFACRDGQPDNQHQLAADEIERLRGRLDKIAKHPDTPELLRQYALEMF